MYFGCSYLSDFGFSFGRSGLPRSNGRKRCSCLFPNGWLSGICCLSPVAFVRWSGRLWFNIILLPCLSCVLIVFSRNFLHIGLPLLKSPASLPYPEHLPDFVFSPLSRFIVPFRMFYTIHVICHRKTNSSSEHIAARNASKSLCCSARPVWSA